MKRWLAALCLVGCTAGVRAEGAFEGEVDLDGLRTVMVDLPSTPLRVEGCDPTVPESCPDSVRVEGRWHAIGASQAEAERTAGRPAVVFERGPALLRISAAVPLEVDGLVDLEVDEVGLPADVDVDLRTSLGDVRVRGMEGSVLVDVEAGDIDVQGPMRSAGLHTGAGDVVAVVEGPVDIEAADGGVYVEQGVPGVDVFVEAPGGDVEVWLLDDTNLDLEVRTPGRVRVQTDAISAQARGRYDARTGTGAVRVEVTAGGDVDIRLRG
ncbi:MAG: hypothetical protein AAGA54_29730 [Myxococcota bacterium]